MQGDVADGGVVLGVSNNQGLAVGGGAIRQCVEAESDTGAVDGEIGIIDGAAIAEMSDEFTLSVPEADKDLQGAHGGIGGSGDTEAGVQAGDVNAGDGVGGGDSGSAVGPGEADGVIGIAVGGTGADGGEVADLLGYAGFAIDGGGGKAPVSPVEGSHGGELLGTGRSGKRTGESAAHRRRSDGERDAGGVRQSATGCGDRQRVGGQGSRTAGGDSQGGRSGTTDGSGREAGRGARGQTGNG